MKQPVLLLLLVASTHAAPVDPSEEVELVEPVNTNDGVPGLSGFPIVVIKTRGSPPTLDSFPFLKPSILFGKDAQFDDFLPSTDENKENVPEIPIGSLIPGFASIFGGSDENSCGLLCQVFKNLETHIRDLEKEVKEVRDKQNEVDGDGAENFDGEGPKTVYEEKVLDDGSILKINKTTFSDINDDGTSFFSFTSTKVVSDDDDDVDENGDAIDDSDDRDIIDDSREIPIDNEGGDEKENVERLRRSPDLNEQQRQQLDDVQFDQQQQQQLDEIEFDKEPPKKYIKKWKQGKKHPGQDTQINMEDDIRVNEIISETAARGGLVYLEPDSEFVDGSAE